MAKKVDVNKSVLILEVDPNECPFREFRDNELHADFWGLGPAAMRAAMLLSKSTAKATAEAVWNDDQTQPLPRSVRQYLNGWIRAEDLAFDRWEAEVVIFEDHNSGKMTQIEIQLSHAQVLLRSSFCRKVMSACFMLERLEGFTVEHQWENFSFSLQPEGWRARYHIYSPGMKPGGGPQHRPGLSKNGCYLVRLFFLGAWRCVWVSDQVPVDATDSPLLPFSPIITHTPQVGPKSTTKQVLTAVTAPFVHLWPLLLCKVYLSPLQEHDPLCTIIAIHGQNSQRIWPTVSTLARRVGEALLKLAAPNMNSDEEADCSEDEPLPEFSIIHALTGSLHMRYEGLDAEALWNQVTAEVPVFSWDDDDETMVSTVKSKSAKKPINKESAAVKRGSMTAFLIEDTKNRPPYYLPGITPAHEMDLLVTMVRDIPVKKPLPEPDVSPWKLYRWVDWARSHGLYQASDCPRTKFVKVNGLLKLSHAPHLLDVSSNESITYGFREEHETSNANKITYGFIQEHEKSQIKKGKEAAISKSNFAQMTPMQLREEMREWIVYNELQCLVKSLSVDFYPSMYQFTSAASSPPIRITKAAPNRALDMPAPKFQPLYLQIDSGEENTLRMSLNVLHPRILMNCGVPIVDYIDPGYVILEVFEWFKDCELPRVKGFIQTRGYNSAEVDFLPGRHFCRIWVYSRTNWHFALLSDSSLLLGPRDLIQCASVRECPWGARFLNALSAAFIAWVRGPRSATTHSVINADQEFYKSYQPDLPWDPKVVGYKKHLLHWMFRQALQSLLSKKLQPPDYHAVCGVLRRYFCDPDLGFPPKPVPTKSLREIVKLDPCDCVIPETEEELILEMDEQGSDVQSLVEPETMKKLLIEPEPPVTSQVCSLATDELPCGILKEEREKVVKKHEAATYLQALWRGTWARKCLNTTPIIAPDVLKIILDNVFGNLESLSALMNEFFSMYPGAKYAYSVASALSGVYSLNQHSGITRVTPRCKWVPYFQGTFTCHAPAKVHFDVTSSLQQSIVVIYDNDTGEQLPQAYNSHITFDVKPNVNGYSVFGHSSLNQPHGTNSDIHWQLTVLCCIEGAFHICDNDPDGCKELPLQSATKMHVDEIFIPNRRNILGGLQISVIKYETVSFRAAATVPELELEAVIRTTNEGEVEIVSRCVGKGELYWPYIRLMPAHPPAVSPVKKSMSQPYLTTAAEGTGVSARSMKNVKATKPTGKTRSISKFKPLVPESKVYTIEVIATNGWPLTLDQWIRVNEVRNTVEKVEAPPKKTGKEKTASAKDKAAPPPPIYQPLPDDAYVELECAYSTVLGATCKRDDERDLLFAATIKGWDAREPGRNLRGANIRKEFRTEYLEVMTPPPLPDSTHTLEEVPIEIYGEEGMQELQPIQQGPSPVTESGMIEMSLESEEEARYLTLPDQLRDKFIPLHFLPLCTREKNEDEGVVLTLDMAQAAKQDRHARIEVALSRMRELQIYNEIYVLGKQKERAQLLDTLFVDSQWNPDLQQVMIERDDAIAQETLNRTLSATKKKEAAKIKK